MASLTVRTSVESFRTVEVTPSREPAEYGKGSGGVLGLNTGWATITSASLRRTSLLGVQTIKGFRSPSGRRSSQVGADTQREVWFIDRVMANMITHHSQLPSGSDTDHVWRIDNLAKVQSNLTAHNLVTLSFLSNYYHDQYAGSRPSASADHPY